MNIQAITFAALALFAVASTHTQAVSPGMNASPSGKLSPNAIHGPDLAWRMGAAGNGVRPS